MKKNIFVAGLVLLTVGIASSALAAAVTIESTTTIGSLSFTPSNNVTVAIDSTDFGYIAGAYHTSGSRGFYTDHNASIIYWIDQSATEFATAHASFAAPTTSAGATTPDLAGTTTYHGM